MLPWKAGAGGFPADLVVDEIVGREGQRWRPALVQARLLLPGCGPLQAGSEHVTVRLNVSTKGLDLSQPADARRLYGHIRQAAWVACTRGDRVGLEPAPNPQACQEKSLADAISSIKVPLLTQIYLQTHTLREAAAHEIEVPEQVASK